MPVVRTTEALRRRASGAVLLAGVFPCPLFAGALRAAQAASRGLAMASATPGVPSGCPVTSQADPGSIGRR